MLLADPFVRLRLASCGVLVAAHTLYFAVWCALCKYVLTRKYPIVDGFVEVQRKQLVWHKSPMIMADAAQSPIVAELLRSHLGLSLSAGPAALLIFD